MGRDEERPAARCHRVSDEVTQSGERAVASAVNLTQIYGAWTGHSDRRC
jgi:hypothetical protein